MLTKATFFLFVASFALPAAAEDKPRNMPRNTIDCAQFKKTGPQEWIENGTAVFALGSIDDINLTNQPVTPGYYKFDGIDLFPVLEQKCGAPPQDAPSAQQAASIAAALAVGLQNASRKPEPEPDKPAVVAAQTPAPAPELGQPAPGAARELGPGQEKASAVAAQKPAPANTGGGAPAAPSKVALEPVQKCQDRKPVYAADSLDEGAGGKAVVEIALETKVKGEAGPDFIIREVRSGEVQWSYRGRVKPGRFLFAAIPYREVSNARFAFSSAPVVRADTVSLPSSFVTPNRDGSGDPILVIHGLRGLFASREESRRFKFEGKRPAELLPEAYYFDRCE